MKRIWPSVSLSILVFLCNLDSPGTAEASQPIAHVPVEEVRLANGMTLLLVSQPEATTVAAGWMVQAGSADDPRGQTGLSHLLEHMMFKGSETIGTRDLDRELEALAEVDRLWSERRSMLTKLKTAPAKRRDKWIQRVDEISTQLGSAQATARSFEFLGQYSFLYSQQGGTDLNANTYRDLTLYFVTLPAEKLEIWFWLESDRLLAPVFREFYKEVQVVHEERRQRIESTPTGRLDEDLRELFWADHPYAWEPMGRSEDLDHLSRQDARDFFARHYGPERMTAVLVGGFDVEQVRSWAKRYFGRLTRSSTEQNLVRPPSTSPTKVEVRLEATCPCPPQVKILYRTAPFGDPDADALQLLSAVLNGRTGRLFRSLVADQGIAFSAYTQQISWRQAGEFSFRGESRGDSDPQRLIEAWDEQVRLLQTSPPTPDEIQRAVNRSTADAFRTLKEPTSLMKQLLIYQGLGDWRYINEWTDRIQKLESEDLVRMAARYLPTESRTVAIYRRPVDVTRR